MISIIIPCYNGARYVRDCVSSLKELTYSNREIIFIDDGSIDDSVTLLTEALEVLKGSFLLRNVSNEGPGKARNDAIDFAEGEYILPLDIDNLLMPESLEKFEEACSQGFIAYSNATKFTDDGYVGKWYFTEYNPRTLWYRNIMENCSMYKREWWQEIGGYDESRELTTYEDWEFWMRMALAGHYGRKIDDVLFKYRVHPDSRNHVAQGDHKRLVDYIRRKNEGYLETIERNLYVFTHNEFSTIG